MLGRRVIMARHDRPEPAGGSDGKVAVTRADTRPERLEFRDVRGEGVVRHAVALQREAPQRGELPELPLSRRMVHQAEDADPVLGTELVQLLPERLGADLGAQVQPVANAQCPGPPHRP
jgi:hypothetical protein